jgi:hypothetical protein
MRLMLTDLRKIAEAADCDPEKLADAALALYPGHDDNHHRSRRRPGRNPPDTAEGQE